MLKNKRKLFLSLAGAMVSLPMLVSAETVFEETTVAYDGGGSDSGSSAAVDLYGNMYVAGVSDNNTYFLAKYDSYGRDKWVKTHSTGQSSWFGKGNTMIVDKSSNAYVAISESYTFGRVLKYDADGNETILVAGSTVPYNWDHRIALALDKGEQNLFLRASNTVSKISLNGGAGWQHQLNGSYNTWVRDIAIDDSGNVYAVGQSQYTTGNGTSDIVVNKFDADGNVLWSKLWYNEGKQSEDAYGIELDSNGNAYVLVQAISYEDTCLYCTTSTVVKFNAAGDEVGSTVLNGTDGYLAGGIKVVDDQLSVTIRNKSTSVLTVQRLNADLSLVWSADYADGYLQLRGLDVDGLGNVVVSVQGNYSAMSIVKFDMYGNQTSSQSVGRGTPAVVQFGATGEIYVGGTVLVGTNANGFMSRYGVTSLTCQ